MTRRGTDSKLRGMRTSSLILLLASSLVLQARVDVPAAGTTLAMLDFGGRPMVDIRINGKGPFPFILDTGASQTIVDESLARELTLPAGGEMGGRAVVTIDEFRVGDCVLRGLRAGSMGGMLSSVSGPNGPRGVLSAAAFPGHLVVLDYPGKRVSIKPGALPVADNRRVFEYRPDEILPVIPVRIAGHEYRIHLDSGSPSAVTLPTRYAVELPLEAPPVTIGTARTVAGSFAVQAATVKGAVEIGEFTVDVPQIKFSDLRPGAEPGIGNVGGLFLKSFIVTFDSANRRVQFERR